MRIVSVASILHPHAISLQLYQQKTYVSSPKELQLTLICSFGNFLEIKILALFFDNATLPHIVVRVCETRQMRDRSKHPTWPVLFSWINRVYDRGGW